MQNRRNFIKDSFLFLGCIPILGSMFKPKADNIESKNTTATIRYTSVGDQRTQEECFRLGIYPQFADLTANEFREMTGIM